MRDDPILAPPADAGLSPTAPLAAALGVTLAKVERASQDPDPVEMVHDARKAMKEYRALLRLAEGGVARSARHGAATVARSLSSARDRATAREALDLLDTAGLARATDLAAARALLADDGTEITEAEHLRATLQTFLSEARAALAGELGAEAAVADLVAGLSRGYRAAQRGRFRDPVSQHETRKRVVTHRYQMSFVATYFGGRGARRARRAQRLRDLLGAYQDIETLRPMLHQAGDVLGGEALLRLDVAMARVQKRLRHRAKRAHQQLFRMPQQLFTRKWRARLGPVRATAA